MSGEHLNLMIEQNVLIGCVHPMMKLAMILVEYLPMLLQNATYL